MMGSSYRRAAWAVLGFSLGLAGPAVGQTVDEVLERHYEAIGGVEAWENVETMRASGTISISGGMMQGPFRIVQKRPAMARIEMTLQDMEIVQAYDGRTAWQIMPMTGSTEPVEADSVTAATIIEQADMDGPLIGWREDGHEVELIGTETVEGQELVKLRLTQRNGSVSIYYLDTDRYLPRRIESEAAAGTSTTRFEDYRDIGGLTFPFSITIDTAVGLQALTFDEVEVNVPVDESVFSMGSG